MSKLYDHLNDRLTNFIEQQRIFFVATASSNSRINLSPKGMDTFKVLDKKRVLWLNLTGSGNETAAHLLADGRITIMFCAFEGPPNIVRIYGKGKSIHPHDSEWSSLIHLFPSLTGSRQLMDITIDSVQTSCGMSIPFYDYKGERDELKEWAEAKDPEEMTTYWKERNSQSIDGIPTGI